MHDLYASTSRNWTRFVCLYKNTHPWTCKTRWPCFTHWCTCMNEFAIMLLLKFTYIPEYTQSLYSPSHVDFMNRVVKTSPVIEHVRRVFEACTIRCSPVSSHGMKLVYLVVPHAFHRRWLGWQWYHLTSGNLTIAACMGDRVTQPFDGQFDGASVT